MIQCWTEYGYHTPRLIKNPFPEFDSFPILVTEFIEGTTLQKVIKDRNISWSDKGSKLETVFSEVNARHAAALARHDNRFFHIDANTRNIMFVNDMVYHVDFEMGRSWESPVKCASREILKMLVCTAEDVTPDERPLIFALFRKCYGINDVYEVVRRSILGRSFQSLHRYNDRRKKLKNPGKVTLYDVLEYLEQTQ
jgi:tRNA A-37 threonylcarbamoyl transferase component Bud32